MSEKNDDQFEHDDLIDSLYRDSADEQPPAKIDNLILAKAKGQTVTVKNPRKPRWAIPLAAVCVPALALGVVLKVGSFNFGDASYEPTSSGVYDTNDFVLHIPEQDAASQIRRVEKPVFDDSNPTALTRGSAIELEEADILAADMQTRMEQETAANVSREQQLILAEARKDTSNDDAYNVEIKKVEATTQQNYDSPVLADAVATEPPVLNEAEIMDLPLAKTEVLDQNNTASSASVVAEPQLEEISVTANKSIPENTAEAIQAMPAPESNTGAVVARGAAPAADQADTGDSTANDLEDAIESCPELRPEVCSHTYQPVCGQRDTGVRCVMAPCNEAVEWRDYGNQCSACADENVYGYYEGSCESLNLPVE